MSGEGEGRIAPNKNRELQVAPSGRKLFDKARKRVFLEWFAGTANLSLSARKAGVHYRTVLRHRMEKPAFREAFDQALEQSTPRLRAWLVEASDAEAAPIEFEAVDDDAEGEAGGEEPGGGEGCSTALGTGRSTSLGTGRSASLGAGGSGPANIDAAQAIQLLRDDRQRTDGAGRRGSGGQGRTPTVASNEEVRQALVKRLKAFGIRVRAERTLSEPGTDCLDGSPAEAGAQRHGPKDWAPAFAGEQGGSKIPGQTSGGDFGACPSCGRTGAA
jgi:hypothetical protein